MARPRLALARLACLLVLASLMAACPAVPYDSSGGASARARPGPEAAGEQRLAPADPSAAPRPEFVEAGDDDADAAVREAMHTATQDRRRLVVYVGATWCEPCQAFHHAVERGELDEALAGVRFVEFDSDHDGGRLQAAGYGGRYIPRFVLPRADGRGSEHRMEGGIKGEGAVANIMERLQPLLAAAEEPVPQ